MEKHMLLEAVLRFMSRGGGFWGALLCFEFFSTFIFIIILSRKVDYDVCCHFFFFFFYVVVIYVDKPARCVWILNICCGFGVAPSLYTHGPATINSTIGFLTIEWKWIFVSVSHNHKPRVQVRVICDILSSFPAPPLVSLYDEWWTMMEPVILKMLARY